MESCIKYLLLTASSSSHEPWFNFCRMDYILCPSWLQIPSHGKKFKNNCQPIQRDSIRVRGKILDEVTVDTGDERGHMFLLRSKGFKTVPSKSAGGPMESKHMNTNHHI